MPKKIILEEKQLKKIKKDYLSNISLEKLSKKYSFSRHTITRLLKDNDIKIRNNGQGKNKNDYYFNKINSSEKAYWLGFLYADGSVGENVNRISIKLKRSDKKHLELFRKNIEGNMCIYDGIDKTYNVPYSQIQVCSKKMKEDLITNGCVPNKTSKITFPYSLEQKFIYDFLRGYFDGDGSLFKRSNRNVWEASFIGTNSFIESISKILNVKTKLVYLDNGFNASLRIYKDVERVMDLLYKDSNIYLERKYKLYLKMKKEKS